MKVSFIERRVSSPKSKITLRTHDQIDHRSGSWSDSDAEDYERPSLSTKRRKRQCQDGDRTRKNRRSTKLVLKIGKFRFSLKKTSKTYPEYQCSCCSCSEDGPRNRSSGCHDAEGEGRVGGGSDSVRKRCRETAAVSW